MLLSSIHAEKKNTSNVDNVDDVEKVQEKISTSLKLADEDAKNRTSKVREVVASVSEHVCMGKLSSDIYLTSLLYFSQNTNCIKYKKSPQ